MGNIPGLSGEAGGTEDLAGVTQGIGWEMFNGTDEDMEVLIRWCYGAENHRAGSHRGSS